VEVENEASLLNWRRIGRSCSWFISMTNLRNTIFKLVKRRKKGENGWCTVFPMIRSLYRDNLQFFFNSLKPKGGNEKSIHEIALVSKTKAQKAIEEKALKKATT
jgi:hypothetical protein